jgi:hypothetical protein
VFAVLVSDNTSESIYMQIKYKGLRIMDTTNNWQNTGRSMHKTRLCNRSRLKCIGETMYDRNIYCMQNVHDGRNSTHPQLKYGSGLKYEKLQHY